MLPMNVDAAVPSSSQQAGLAATTNKRNRPRYHPFTQQQLPACHFILKPPTAIAAIALVGIIFIPIGLACMAASNKVVEVVDQYETACIPEKMRDNKVAYIQNPSTDKSCPRLLKVHAHMKAPIYVYYKLDKFDQNHRRYARSRSISQLGSPKMAKDTKTCSPEATAKGGGPIVPCGLVAWSLFNDTYGFARRNETLAVNRQGISWRSDRGHLFGDRVYPRNFQAGALVGGGTLDPNKSLSEQEDLMVWMRTAALPAFRKLYGRIEVDLHAGDEVAVTVQNNYNTYSFGGKKALVLSTAGVLGGKSSFLGRAYLAGGIACLALALLLTLLFLLPVPAHASSS
ncbi:hypothetical protein BDA96_02G312500 [Sorghum bicolor]|uniref:ALA-interacting subunit n=1 Tax=Sorghum bicolor TaxID=4558 RepID=A0A921UUB9_SORBI|nr:ALA-interacting subunit 5 [Sorghum bicolor]KAG0544854.1 hypothetical protein BDA96_02G312500 [Sorghum bicolor]|eukprot:XP_021307825.1 ALA-interacting subunit 5 [Sorghum bicolor]